MGISASMSAVAALLADDERVKRPVTCDPRNLVWPGVLVEPPRLDTTTATGCGIRAVINVYAVGVPGAWAEFQPLAELADAVVDVIRDADSISLLSADFVSFQLPPDMSAAESSVAYQIQCEVFV